MRDISRRTRISRIEGFVDDFRGISRCPSRRKAIGVPADMFTIAAGSPPEQSRARIPLDPLLRGTASRGREDGRERTEIRGRRHGERVRSMLDGRRGEKRKGRRRWSRGEHDSHGAGLGDSQVAISPIMAPEIGISRPVHSWEPVMVLG